MHNEYAIRPQRILLVFFSNYVSISVGVIRVGYSAMGSSL